MQIRFDADSGAYFEGFVPCRSTDGAFSLNVQPGTYSVSAFAEDASSSFPRGHFVVAPKLEITGALSGLSWSVRTETVTGHLTVEGAPPAPADSSKCRGGPEAVGFGSVTGAGFAALVPCDTTDGAFTAHVAPGTYQVTASGTGEPSNIPDGDYVLVDQLKIP